MYMQKVYNCVVICFVVIQNEYNVGTKKKWQRYNIKMVQPISSTSQLLMLV